MISQISFLIHWRFPISHLHYLYQRYHQHHHNIMSTLRRRRTTKLLTPRHRPQNVHHLQRPLPHQLPHPCRRLHHPLHLLRQQLNLHLRQPGRPNALRRLQRQARHRPWQIPKPLQPCHPRSRRPQRHRQAEHHIRRASQGDYNCALRVCLCDGCKPEWKSKEVNLV